MSFPGYDATINNRWLPLELPRALEVKRSARRSNSSHASTGADGGSTRYTETETDSSLIDSARHTVERPARPIAFIRGDTSPLSSSDSESATGSYGVESPQTRHRRRGRVRQTPVLPYCVPQTEFLKEASYNMMLAPGGREPLIGRKRVRFGSSDSDGEDESLVVQVREYEPERPNSPPGPPAPLTENKAFHRTRHTAYKPRSLPPSRWRSAFPSLAPDETYIEEDYLHPSPAWAHQSRRISQNSSRAQEWFFTASWPQAEQFPVGSPLPRRRSAYPVVDRRSDLLEVPSHPPLVEHRRGRGVTKYVPVYWQASAILPPEEPSSYQPRSRTPAGRHDQWHHRQCTSGPAGNFTYPYYRSDVSPRTLDGYGARRGPCQHYQDRSAASWELGEATPPHPCAMALSRPKLDLRRFPPCRRCQAAVYPPPHRSGAPDAIRGYGRPFRMTGLVT